MKNIKLKSILLAGVACLGLSSCGDFLEIEPKTFVSEDNFWNEKTDIDQTVIGVYTKLQADDIIRRCIIWGEARSENILDGLNCERDQKDIYRTLQEQLLPTNPFTNWQSFYSVINTCNIVIERAPEVSQKDPVFTQSDVLATQAEMAFVRDLCYFYLVRAFKDVPYYTHAIQVDEDAQPIAATNGDQIVQNLIADLESVVSNALKAYPKDDNARYNSNCNRATQSSIYALLADLCLWSGQYQKCVDYAQRVIDAKLQEYHENYAGRTGMSSTVTVVNGNVVTRSDNVALFKWNGDTGEGYPLIPCFSSLSSNSYGADFNSIFGGTGNSFESIFELAYTTNGNDSYLSNSACGALYGNHYSTGSNSGRGFLTVADGVFSDIPNNINSIFDHGYDERFYTNMKPEKPGDYSTADITKFVSYSATVTPATGSNNQNLRFSVSHSYNTGNYHDRNWIFYRLTDVMLMQAEALIEMAQHDDYEVRDDEGNLLKDSDGEQVYDADLTRAFGLIYAVNRRSIMVPSVGTHTTATANELKITKYNTRNLMRDLCKAERRRELMFEGKRWFDILRYNRREGGLTNIPQKRNATRIVNTEALYWPYYRYELKNNPLLKQKPYYDTSSENSEDANSTTE